MVTSVGFGDITPKSNSGQIAVIFFGTTALIIIGWAIASFSAYQQSRMQHLMQKVRVPESSSDPYVAIRNPIQCCPCIRGCESYSNRTPTRLKELNPTWDDGPVWTEYRKAPFRILVFDEDKLDYDDLIGYVLVDPAQATSDWCEYNELLDDVDDPQSQARLQFAMRLAAPGKLELRIRGCTDLPIMDDYSGVLQSIVVGSRELFVAVMLFFIVLFGSALVFKYVETWRYFDAVYFCTITMTTIGYGDFSPKTKTGRVLFIPFSFISISILGYLFGLVQASGNTEANAANLPLDADGDIDFDKIFLPKDSAHAPPLASSASLSASTSASTAGSSASGASEEEEQEHQQPQSPTSSRSPAPARIQLRGAYRRGTGRARQYMGVAELDALAQSLNARNAADGWSFDELVEQRYGIFDEESESLSASASASPVLVGSASSGQSGAIATAQPGTGVPTPTARRAGLSDWDLRLRKHIKRQAQGSMLGTALLGLTTAARAVQDLVPKKLRPSTYFGNGIKYRLTRQLVIAAVIVLLGTFIALIEDWSWFQSLYFCVVTSNTVGYGEFSPKTDGGKAFVIIFALLSVSTISGVLALMSEASVTSTARDELIRVRNHIYARRPLCYRCWHSHLIRIPLFMGLITAFVFIGAGAFSSLEDDVPYLRAVYWAVVTITSIGFGDYFPTNDRSRGFVIFYIIVGLAQLSHLLFLIQSYAVRKVEETIEFDEMAEIDKLSLDMDDVRRRVEEKKNLNTDATSAADETDDNTDDNSDNDNAAAADGGDEEDEDEEDEDKTTESSVESTDDSSGEDDES